MKTILLPGAVVLALIFGATIITHKTSAQIVSTSPQYFAEIDPKTDIVKRVIVISQSELNTGRWGNPTNWKETDPTGNNYASAGYTWDDVDRVFIPPRPSTNYVYDHSTNMWRPDAATQAEIDSIQTANAASSTNDTLKDS
ncbi:MAG: hypothetical protein L0287_22370 [Anaerolineae bacterium]|nr:hypothetical protein [Anaerolineae bacterium]